MQTKAMSAIETVVGTSFKFAWAMAMWQFLVAPMFNLEVTLTSNFFITGIFTINSMLIGYGVRRFFNNRS